MKNLSDCGKDGPLEGRRKQAHMPLSYYKNEDLVFEARAGGMASELRALVCDVFGGRK